MSMDEFEKAVDRMEQLIARISQYTFLDRIR